MSRRPRGADRYFGSFPKVGIVVPSPAAWLLPELQDEAHALTTTLDLPAVVGHGASVEPTSDGLLIWLPSSAPRRARTHLECAPFRCTILLACAGLSL